MSTTAGAGGGECARDLASPGRGSERPGAPSRAASPSRRPVADRRRTPKLRPGRAGQTAAGEVPSDAGPGESPNGRCADRLAPGAASSGGRRRQAGFTLVELAVVIAIVGFLLGAFLAPLRAQLDAARVREAERMLDEIRDALIGYAVSEGALPCPDVVADGIDGAAPAACTGAALEGVLPYQTLGVHRSDPWGRHFRYRVTEEFSNRSLTGQPPGAGRLDLADVGDVTVLTRGDDPATGGTVELKHQSVGTALVRTAPAVVLSAGPNGLGGIAVATGVALASPSGGAADEVENADADATFVSRLHAAGATDCDDADETSAPPRPSCEFDDIVVWIPTPVLMARLVAARVLP